MSGSIRVLSWLRCAPTVQCNIESCIPRITENAYPKAREPRATDGRIANQSQAAIQPVCTRDIGNDVESPRNCLQKPPLKGPEHGA
jgi:hypothetical protein